MRERIGTTRSGKLIEIDWVFINGKWILKEIVWFVDPADTFDQFAALEETTMIRIDSPDQRSQQDAIQLEEALSEFAKSPGMKRVFAEARRLGVHTSPQRRILAARARIGSWKPDD